MAPHPDLFVFDVVILKAIKSLRVLLGRNVSCWINASQGEDLISGPRFPPTHLQDLLQDFPGLFHWSVHIGGSSGQKQHWEDRELEKATR